MAEADDFINQAYPAGSVSTSDILARMPEERGTLLPIMRKGNQLSAAVPGAIHEPYMALQRLLSGYGYSPGTQDEQGVKDSTALAGAVGLPGLGINSASATAGRSAVGAFIGPEGAKRLAIAGIRHPDDWGGIGRLAAAREQPGWMRPGSPEHAEIWKNFGWTPEHTWGGKFSPRDQPATVIATPRFSLDENKFYPMRTSHPEGAYDVLGANGRLADLTHGLDEAFVAEPSLRTVPTQMTIDPHGSYGGANILDPIYEGAKIGPSQRLQRFARGADPTGWGIKGIEAHAPTAEDLQRLMQHEALGHAFATSQGVARSQIRAGGQMLSPIRGSAAEKELQSQLMLYELMRRRAEGTANEAMLNQAAQVVRQQHESTPGYVGYLDSAPERLARERDIRGLAALPEHKQMIPGSVDTYQEGAMGRGFKEATGFPLRHYAPPSQE